MGAAEIGGARNILSGKWSVPAVEYTASAANAGSQAGGGAVP
jgi:hypothetical protein